MLLPNLDDEEFIEYLYKEILNRQPDEKGFEEHLQKLKNGHRSRLSTAGVFIQSDENKQKNGFRNLETNHKGRSIIKDWGNSVREYYLEKLLNASKIAKGAVIELGVYRGETAEILNKHTDRELYLFDTYNGFPTDYTVGGYDFSDTSKRLVKKRVGDEPNIIEGDVRKTTNNFDKDISFIHFDLDEYEATKKSLQNLYTNINPGGIALFDEYDFEEFEEDVRRAAREFTEDKREEIISLRNGQGFFIKH